MSTNSYITDTAMAFDLLARIVGAPEADGGELAAQLAGLERFLYEDFTAFSRQGAPPNAAELFDRLEAELWRFREYTEFPGIAGKVVVGLGGGFSAGKSSFINGFFGQRSLPTSLVPTTAVPTYVIQGDVEAVCGLNAFGRRVDLDVQAFRAITHDFHKQYKVAFGHLLKAMFVQVPYQAFAHLAFLDTPGYSKADAAVPGGRSDERLTRTQLLGADRLIWLVDAESGLPGSDVAFLRSLGTNVPILVLVNKVEKKQSDLAEILAATARALEGSGLSVLDILPISARQPEDFAMPRARSIITGWGVANQNAAFVQNFKAVFTAYAEHFKAEAAREAGQLARLNRVSLRVETEDPAVKGDVHAALHQVQVAQRHFKERGAALKVLEGQFFTLLRRVAARTGTTVPDPELIALDAFRLSVVEALRAARGLAAVTWLADLSPVIGKTMDDLRKGASIPKARRMGDAIATTLVASGGKIRQRKE